MSSLDVSLSYLICPTTSLILGQVRQPTFCLPNNCTAVLNEVCGWVQLRTQHPLRERAKKLDQGILVIRFEMPFNVFCACGKLIGKVCCALWLPLVSAAAASWAVCEYAFATPTDLAYFLLALRVASSCS